VTPKSSCVLLQWLCTTGRGCVTLDNSCVLLRWMCSTGGRCVTPESSCVLLQWMRSTSSDHVSLDNSCVLLDNSCDLLDDIVVAVCYQLIFMEITRSFGFSFVCYRLIAKTVPNDSSYQRNCNNCVPTSRLQSSQWTTR
jgi:hypothetical protein